MKTTRIILLCALILFTGASFAQTLKITLKTYGRTEEYGEYIKPYVVRSDIFNQDKIDNRIWHFNPDTKRGYEPLGPTTECYHFALYTSFTNFSAIKTVCVNTNHNAKQQLVIEKIVQLGGKQYLVYALIDKKLDEKVYYLHEVSPTLDMVGNGIQACTLHNFKGEGVESMVRVSPNGKTILFAKGNMIPNTEAHEKLECAVLDENLKPLWQKDLNLSMPGTTRVLDEVAVDDLGNLYALTAYDQNVSSAVTRKLVKPALCAYFWSKSDKVAQMMLGDESRTNYGSKLIVSQDNAVVAGLSGSKSKLGYFIYQANAATATVDKLGSEALTKGEFVTQEFRIKNLEKLSNGDIVFSAEESYGRNFSNGLSYSYSGPILAVSWNGKTNWEHAIFKEQKGYSTEASHILIPFEDKTIAMYNDNSENIGIDPDSDDVKTFNGKNTSVTVVKIERSGEIKKELLDIGNASSGYSLEMDYRILAKDMYYVRFIQDNNKFWPATLMIK